jgi:hypothetical protein
MMKLLNRLEKSMFEAKTHCLEQDQLVPKGREEVFQFFSDAFNLERLTPPFLNFKILTEAPIAIEPGTLIDYKIRLFGVPMRWRTRIARFEPDELFVDEQIRGPYALWHHTHTFEETPEGTLMRDIVKYRLPLGWLGDVAHALFVRATLKRIFRYRRDALADCLEEM